MGRNKHSGGYTMKKLKKLVSLLTAVAICVLLPNFSALTAHAEEGVTYYVKYLDSEEAWRFQTGSTWDDEGYHRELYYMNQDIKDGDLVIVDGIVSDEPLNIPAYLSNLTILHGNTAVVTTKGVDHCFILNDSVAAINGDVKNAYVYDNARCTFNNNVDTLLISGTDDLHATVTVGGTVNHLTGSDSLKTHYDYYSFPAGKLVINDGSVKTDETLFSKTAPAAQPEAPAPAEPSQPQTPSGEYDDVPKTGESKIIFYLLGISALCLIGRAYLKKTK